MIAVMLLASCSTEQPPQQASSAPTGVRVVEGRVPLHGPHEEFDFKGGTIIAYYDFHKAEGFNVHYNDGTVVELRPATYNPAVKGCPALNTCTTIHYGPTWDELIVSRDGRPWADSELWAVSKDEPHPVGPAFLGMSRSSAVSTFQGCKDGKIYSSRKLPSLMSVLENEKSADAGKPPASGNYDSKTEREVYVVGDVESTRMPVCNWRHRIGLDKLLPAPKSTRAKLVPASEKTPQHLEATTEQSVTIDWFANKTPLDQLIIKLPNGHSISIKPRYGSPNCPDFKNCGELAVTKDNTTIIQQALDGRSMNKSRLWKEFNPLGGPTTYAACAGGTIFSGRNRAQVEAALAGAEKKSSPQQDMVLDPGSGAFLPADVAAIATPMCDWTQRDKAYQKMIDAAKKARKDAADSTSVQQ
jgi:hypothetical protein